MITLAAVLAAASAAASPDACRCPCALPAATGPGLVHLIARPTPEAYALNQAGRELYRNRRWEEARAKYRAALAADPSFLGPRLNIACSYAQEQRFGEAVSEATALAHAGFVPWAREVKEAADLAPLHGRPELPQLEVALDEAAAEWGASLAEAVMFVARTEPAVRLPPQGVLYLGLNQEIFGWFPRNGRYRQITAEDGRILAFLRFAGGRRLLYVRAGKLVREPGQPPRLRGLTLRELDLHRMSLGPVVALSGDVESLRLEAQEGAQTVVIRVQSGGQPRALRIDGARLVPLAESTEAGHRGGQGEGAVWLDGSGAHTSFPAIPIQLLGCSFKASEAFEHDVPAVMIRASGRAPFPLEAPLGAGLAGLPLPKPRP